MLAVDAQRHRDELRLTAPALGEQRAQRTIDHAGDERALLGRTALALEEGAGDLARGVHALFDVHRQREEVDVAEVARSRCAQNHCVALADDDGAGGLLGHLAGLEGDLGSCDLDGDTGLGSTHMKLSFCSGAPVVVRRTCVLSASVYEPRHGSPVRPATRRREPRHSALRRRTASASSSRRRRARRACPRARARRAASARRSSSKRARSRPRSRARCQRCGSSRRPWSAYSASANGQNASCAAAASAASGDGDGARVLGLQREVAEGDGAPARREALVGEGAARAGEVGVEDDQRRVGGAADVVVVAQRGRRRAAQVAHRASVSAVLRDAPPSLQREQRLPAPARGVFAFFADARNLEAITPPLLRFRVVTPEPIAMGQGTLIRYRLRVHGVPVSWLTEITDVGAAAPLRRRADRGALRAVAPHAHASSRRRRRHAHARRRALRAVGFGPLGALANRLLVRRDVEAIFDFRAERIPALLAAA